MERLRKFIVILVLAAAACLPATVPAFAESRIKIEKVYLNLNTDIRVGTNNTELEITKTGASSDFYTIDDYEVTNEEDSWRTTSAPLIKIYLSVIDEDCYYFPTATSSGFKLTLDESIQSRFEKVEFVSASRKDDKTIVTVTFRLIFNKDKYKAQIGSPSDVYWIGTRACWKDIPNAKNFEAQLFKDGNAISAAMTTYEAYYDFSELITTPGTYTFNVRSVKEITNVKSTWRSSGELILYEDGTLEGSISEDEIPEDIEELPGTWQTAEDGRLTWLREDGTSPVSAWELIYDNWYYFDSEGYMATGWIEVDGYSYYLDTDSGVLFTNTRTPDGYWVNQDGQWVPGS